MYSATHSRDYVSATRIAYSIGARPSFVKEAPVIAELRRGPDNRRTLIQRPDRTRREHREPIVISEHPDPIMAPDDVKWTLAAPPVVIELRAPGREAHQRVTEGVCHG